MEIDYTLTDQMVSIIKRNLGIDVSRNKMFKILTSKGLLNKDGSATDKAIKNGLVARK